MPLRPAEQGKLRATQSLVSHMGFVWRHPSLTAIEVAWRWIFGVPFLMVLWGQAQQILARIPPDSVGLDRLDFQNPWLSSVILADAISRYEAPAMSVLRWLLPVGVVGWAIVSGLGRTLVLMRMNTLDPMSKPAGDPFLRKLPGYIGLQGLWMLALLACLWLWYRAVGWACATHITVGAQPDLLGYLCWLIFLSLGIFVLWALLSWTLAMAPLLLFLEGDGRPGASFRALLRSFSLGKALSSKLMEVSLVLAIVKIMLIVLDMVFSAAPLPFASEFGPDALHVVDVVVFVGFLVGNDFFHVVRLRSFRELWRHYCHEDKPRRVSKAASTTRIEAYPVLRDEFIEKIFDNEYEQVWISDGSSLWDFATGRTLEPHYAKIRQMYGVDVSDIEGALLWKIFKRIADESK